MDFDYLRSFPLKEFLEAHTAENIISLKKRYGKLGPILSSQITLYNKAREKLPVFTGSYCYFTRKSLEQSSSQPLALYKAGLFSGNKMLDLTGGLGADDWAFASSFKKVLSVDNDNQLNKLVKINFGKLGIDNIERIDADAYDFINTGGLFDLIYLDADRRLNGKRKISLNDSEPNVLKIISRLMDLSKTILLKLSPMIDLTYLQKNLRNISRIYVIAYENEVKEVLTVLNKNFEGNVILTAVDLMKDNVKREFSPCSDVNPLVPDPENGNYFYDPSASIIKAGLVKEYASARNLSMISEKGIYLTSDEKAQDFMGREFNIIEKLVYRKSSVKNYLKLNSISKANVAARNFPAKPEEIKRVFNIKDGGNEFLFLREMTKMLS